MRRATATQSCSSSRPQQTSTATTRFGAVAAFRQTTHPTTTTVFATFALLLAAFAPTLLLCTMAEETAAARGVHYQTRPSLFTASATVDAVVVVAPALQTHHNENGADDEIARPIRHYRRRDDDNDLDDDVEDVIIATPTSANVHAAATAAAAATTNSTAVDDDAADAAAAAAATITTTATPTPPPQPPSPPLPLNDRPIVGVLAQEVGWHLESKWPGTYHSYIAASYVKFVEGGGARVAPIWIGRPRAYYEDIMTKINGVLLPGGATWFNATDGYAAAGRHIYEIAVRLNDAGHAMPIWGTCLGMELLAYITSERGDPRAECASQRQALHLDFEPDFRQSRLFAATPQPIVDILAGEPVTANFHSYCVTRQNISDFGLAAQWRVLATNRDWNGFEFVSAMEHWRYPFWGVIFHPEKPLYEWVRNRNIPHTATAVRANQWFAQRFVDACRESRQQFPGGVDEENGVLIYNYATNFTGLVKSAYQECYMFEAKADYVEHVRLNEVTVAAEEEEEEQLVSETGERVATTEISSEL